MEENECIICFEIINKNINYYHFECNHCENMHYECILNLDKCPFCRSPTRVPSIGVIILIHNSRCLCNFSMCILLHGFLLLLIFSLYELCIKYINNESLFLNEGHI